MWVSTVILDMATRQQHHPHKPTERVKLLGCFTLHGDTDNVRLTISKNLEMEDFPSEVGEDVKVELVLPEESKPYLRVMGVE